MPGDVRHGTLPLLGVRAPRYCADIRDGYVVAMYAADKRDVISTVKQKEKIINKTVRKMIDAIKAVSFPNLNQENLYDSLQLCNSCAGRFVIPERMRETRAMLNTPMKRGPVILRLRRIFDFMPTHEEEKNSLQFSDIH